MQREGAFDRGDVWLMAHPTVAHELSPMGARHNVVLSFKDDDHFK